MIGKCEGEMMERHKRALELQKSMAEAKRRKSTNTVQVLIFEMKFLEELHNIHMKTVPYILPRVLQIYDHSQSTYGGIYGAVFGNIFILVFYNFL